MTVAATLAEAAGLLDKKPDRALLALLDVWRATRSPEIADLVDRVNRRVTRRPLGGANLRERTKRWNEVAEARDPLDLPRLVAALASNQAVAAQKRLDVLASFPDDPRLARALADFVATPPYHMGTAMSVATTRAKDTLVRIADVRVATVLAAHPELVAAIRARAAQLEVPLDDAARTALARLASGFSEARSGDDLLAAVRAAPDDDAPRIVYADWLLEQGDTRGELVHLQLAAAKAPLDEAAAARERELLKLHERAILGPITKVTTTRGRTIRRGFPFRCTLEPKNHRTMMSVATAPEWLTVEELHIGGPFTAPEVLVLPAFRNVRRIVGAWPPAIAALAAADPPSRVTALEISIYTPEHRRPALAELHRLPELRELVVVGLHVDELRELLAGPLGARLHRLEIPSPGELSGEHLVVALPSALRELELHANGHRYRATRAGPGPWTLALPDPAFVFGRVLQALPPDVVAGSSAG